VRHSAPEAFGEVRLEGRFGIVLRRLDGPTLLQLSRIGAMTFAQAGAILATVCISVHKTPPPRDVLSLSDPMSGSLRLSGGVIPELIATGDRAPAAGGRAVSCRPSPRQCNHDGGWSEDHRLDRCGPRADRLRLGSATSSFPSSLRKSPTIRTAEPSTRPCSPSTRGWPACPPRRLGRRWSSTRPSPGSAPFSAELLAAPKAVDSEHRSDPALGGRAAGLRRLPR
jgi:hypothetical protein